MSSTASRLPFSSSTRAKTPLPCSVGGSLSFSSVVVCKGLVILGVGGDSFFSNFYYLYSTKLTGHLHIELGMLPCSENANHGVDIWHLGLGRGGGGQVLLDGWHWVKGGPVDRVP